MQVPRCTNSDDNVKSFYAQELAAILMKIYEVYEDDYKLLGIPHPSWINEMTGERHTKLQKYWHNAQQSPGAHESSKTRL